MDDNEQQHAGEQPQPGAADAWAGQPDPHWTAYSGQTGAAGPPYGDPYGRPGAYGPGSYGWYAGPPGPGQPGQPGSPGQPRQRRFSGPAATAVGVAALLVAGGLVGAGVAHVAWTKTSATQATGSGNAFSPFSGGLGSGGLGSSGLGSGTQGQGGQGQFSPFGGSGQGQGQLPGGGFGSLPGGSTSSGSSNASDGPSDAAAIAKNVDPGVVDITTTLSDGVAAGTGMVLTATGEVLTNNHVIDGARSISVRDVGNGKTYAATVVGYDRTQDIAVLQLKGASGLSTIKVSSGEPGKGAAVVGIGNAGGTGGTPSYAGGAITATGQSITASSEADGTSEKLTGLLQTDAAIEAGDSGGPLVNASGEVVGMDTAASQSQGFTFSGSGGSTAQGFAIPIDEVLAVARQIESGQASTAVHVGPTAELGVYVSTQGQSSGVEVAGVAANGPASRAGLQQGDAITSIAGVRVADANALSSEMTRLRPGQTVTVTYTGGSGQPRSARVTLASGPPQ